MTRSIWKKTPDLEELKSRCEGTLSSRLGIAFTEVGPNFLAATMPIDERTIQPIGMLHGGGSAALAETVASAAAQYCADLRGEICLGIELNINHLKAVRKGFVKGVASPLHLGRSTQVWEIKIYNEEGGLIAVSRLTLAVLKKESPATT